MFLTTLLLPSTPKHKPFLMAGWMLMAKLMLMPMLKLKNKRPDN